MAIGYFQEPAIRGDTLVFLSDDDLWRVTIGSRHPNRLTASRGIPHDPRISPDGQWLAFTGNEEGTREVYLVSLNGGELRRLTYTGFTGAKVIGWTPDSRHVLFTSHAERPFRSWNMIRRVSIDDSIISEMNVGWGSSLDFGPDGGKVLGRFGRDPAQWKRYRGGRKGEIWIDVDDSGTFKKLLDLESNLAWPMWVGDRIIFLGDQDGTGNLYDCTIDGKDIRQRTHHTDFYVRNPSTDGKTVVYQMGGDIWQLDLESGKTQCLELHLPSTFTQRQRKMPNLKKFVESIDIHPKNCASVAVARGKIFRFPHWAGPVHLHGLTDGSVRYRLARWLNDGDRFVAVTDTNGDERLVLFNATERVPPEILEPMPLGRPNAMHVIPGADVLIITNHRHEILQVDLETRTCQIIDTSEYHRLTECDVSPDGRWIAYPCSVDPHRIAIKLYDRENNEITQVTEPLLWDRSPAFDPGGRYLFFLSARMFDPVRDVLDFGYSFPRGVIPMALPLRREFLNPFDEQPASPCDADAGGGNKTAESEVKTDGEERDTGEKDALEPVIIEFDDIRNRAVAMPVIDGRFEDIQVTEDKVWILEHPISGTLSNRWPPEQVHGGTLDYWDLKTQSREHFASNVRSFRFSMDRKVIAYRTNDGVRILDASKKPSKDAPSKPGRKSGWIDLGRLKVTIEPAAEWLQMFRETWRLMRDHYFAEDMSGVDWKQMHDRYLPRVRRCGTRSELSDIIWECIGETGTSHAYEFGGEYEPPPRYTLGKLAADLALDPESGRFVFTHIVHGDSWNPNENSPLNQPGINVQPGHQLIAINGLPVTADRPPGEHLLGLAGQKTALTISDGEAEWTVSVKLISNEMPARLREWINTTAAYVHERTNGRVGYLYMQDMGTTGFAQFYRAWLAESYRDAVIVDVRNNGGGHVSSLLLERLTRRRLGYEVGRYTPAVPTPPFCVRGPIVALCDEFSGSDGDLFAHKFKSMKLGTLIGRRTWGGVVGIAPTHGLVDGTVVTQPEFYHYFDDVGWDLENRGAEPDIVVEYPPEAAARGEDPQLDRAIAVILEQLEDTPSETPELPLHPRKNI